MSFKEKWVKIVDDTKMIFGQMMSEVWHPLSLFGKCTIGIPILLISSLFLCLLMFIDVWCQGIVWLFLKKNT